ncbi:MAG TPA: hypothetical protein IAA98_08910 [Candidatus Avipropionibacterium avicola]|uniref:Uncharacterized protein n=1 Tax=Candidatus Avipropionibacterium avicola TaxID=2840701 RepID=A0A9D1KMP3_9ACTN|nr:hypothetical protein [Candidatus Avipropionibacterium avicola]
MSDIQPILDALSAGRINAAEAAQLIEAVRAGDHAAAQDEQNPPHEPSDDELGDRSERDGFHAYAPPPPRKGFSDEHRRSSAPGAKGVERVVIRASGRRVRVVGDTGVATVQVDGPHVLRRNRQVLEITSEGSFTPSFDGVGLLRSRNLKEARDHTFGGKELVVRVNPALLVEAELSGGGLSTVGVSWIGQVRVTGGGANLAGVAECTDVLVQAGQAVVQGTFRTGRSRIRVESGRGVVDLTEDSNVTVRGEANLGKVSWTGAHSGDGDEVVVGLGNARLDVEAVLAYVTVKVGDPATV